VNSVGPIESTYRWQGKVETASEYLLVIKTTADAVERVRETIQSLHSYEVPEIIVLNVEGGSGAYLNWIAESVGVPSR
jgi:periplasmic divalent cation tolerance protein